MTWSPESKAMLHLLQTFRSRFVTLEMDELLITLNAYANATARRAYQRGLVDGWDEGHTCWCSLGGTQQCSGNPYVEESND